MKYIITGVGCKFTLAAYALHKNEGDSMVRRTNRQLTRLYFILVLVMAFFGGWYADRNWQPDFSNVGQKPVVENGNWIDFFSVLGEETIQLFLGLTTPSK